MKYFVLSLALAALARAQNNTLIPSGISSSCTGFLASLNNNTQLQSCITPLINTTSSFSPTAQTNLSSDDISKTLDTLCKSSTCQDGTIRSWLAEFYNSCNPELTSSTPNAQVRELYDILYVIQPLRSAVCSKNSANQDYCLNEIALRNSSKSTSASASASGSASATGSASASASASATAGNSNNVVTNNFALSAAFDPIAIASENLYILVSDPINSIKKRFMSMVQRDPAQSVNTATVITPNMTTYRNTNLAYLFLQPNMNQAQLCTPCTREVMVSYISWEVTQPYALGLSSSSILGGQGALWNSINSTCGAAYVNAITSQVGITAEAANATSAADRTIGGHPGLAAVTVAGLAFAVGALTLL